MSAPIVRREGEYLLFLVPGHEWEYDPLRQPFLDAPERLLLDMREKMWWTPEHERELERVLGKAWMETATRRLK